MPEDLLVSQKQHDQAYEELVGDLRRAGLPNPREVAKALSNHMLKNTLPSFLTVERWAHRQNATQPSSGFDAIVTAGANSNPGARSFGTVFDAIRYLDSLGFVTARIGIVARGGTVTENSALGATTSMTSVEIAGTDGGVNSSQMFGAMTRWDLAGFSTTGTGLKGWRLHQVHVISGAGKASFFEGSGLSVWLFRSQLFGSASATNTTMPLVAVAGSVVYMYESRTVDVAISATVGFSCFFAWSICHVFTFASSWIHFACQYAFIGNTNFSFSWSGLSALISLACEITNGDADNGAGTAFITWTSTTARYVFITASGPQRGIDSNKLLLAISGHLAAHIDVIGNGITLGVSGSSTGSTRIMGTFSDAVDLTGPAVVNLVCERATIRGKGLTGDVNIIFTTSGGTALNGISITDSGLNVTARRTAASSTQKSFAFDAGSVRDVIIFTGKADFPTVGTKTNASVLIIDEDGPSGITAAALPATAVTPGTYGDSTNVGQFTVDAAGRITLATNVAIAGGGGGDASDFTTAFLMGS